MTGSTSPTQAPQQRQSSSAPHPWRFFVYSGIGIFAFFVPIPIAGETTILLDHLVGWITALLGDNAKYVVFAIIIAGAIALSIQVDGNHLLPAWCSLS